MDQDHEMWPMDHDHETWPMYQDHETWPMDQDHETWPMDQDHETWPMDQDHETWPMDQDHETWPIDQDHETWSMDQDHETWPMDQDHEKWPIDQDHETWSMDQDRETWPIDHENVTGIIIIIVIESGSWNVTGGPFWIVGSLRGGSKRAWKLEDHAVLYSLLFEEVQRNHRNRYLSQTPDDYFVFTSAVWTLYTDDRWHNTQVENPIQVQYTIRRRSDDFQQQSRTYAMSIDVFVNYCDIPVNVAHFTYGASCLLIFIFHHTSALYN